MPRFIVRALSAETRHMHRMRNGLTNRNWQKTLSLHGAEIECLLHRLNVLDTWRNGLQANPVAKELIPEMWMDGYVSIIYASMSLYKYANMSMRSNLETVLRLIYFSTHPVEFGWWKKNSEWYKGSGDVWGKGFEYFTRLELFQKFDKECASDGKALFGDGGRCLCNLYDSLSGSIHTRPGRFQTSASRFSPKYDAGKYDEWSKYFVQNATYTNILLALSFSREFNAMQEAQKTIILDVGISDYYKEKIEAIVSQK